MTPQQTEITTVILKHEAIVSLHDISTSISRQGIVVTMPCGCTYDLSGSGYAYGPFRAGNHGRTLHKAECYKQHMVSRHAAMEAYDEMMRSVAEKTARMIR